MVKLEARVCAGCGKPLGVIAIFGAYWHLKCFRKATEQEQNEAKAKMAQEQRDRSKELE